MTEIETIRKRIKQQYEELYRTEQLIKDDNNGQSDLPKNLVMTSKIIEYRIQYLEAVLRCLKRQ